MDCCICKENYSAKRVPKALRCGHTICEPCCGDLKQLINLGKSLSCPTCRGLSPAAYIQTNFAILSYIEDQTFRAKSAVPRVMCANHLCEPVTKFCRMCSVFVCGECTDERGIHDCHPVVSAEVGLMDVKHDASRFVSRAQSVSTEVTTSIKTETERARSALDDLNDVENSAKEFFNATVTKFRDQLEKFLDDVSVQRSIITNKTSKLSIKRDALDTLARGIAPINDIGNATAYLAKRDGYQSKLDSLSETSLIPSDSGHFAIDPIEFERIQRQFHYHHLLATTWIEENRVAALPI